MELRGTCHTIRYFEKLCDGLKKDGIAKIVKDIKTDDEDGKVKDEVRVYEVFIGEYADTSVFTRFWYDNKHDRANIKMSPEAVDALLESGTIMGLMYRLGQQVSKNGHGVNSEELKVLMKKAIKQMSGKEEDIEVSL